MSFRVLVDWDWPHPTAAIGTYEPDESTTGVRTPEANLDEYNSPATESVTIPANAEISGKIIYGDVTYAGNAEIHNSLLLGGLSPLTSGNKGVLNCTNVRSGIARHYDCTIRPRTESDGRDCALGWQYELYRCHMSKGVDGCGIYKTSTPFSAAVKVMGCLIEDLAYAYPDRDHSDGTHNDCVQIQGGSDIEIVGNAFRGTSHWMAGSGRYYAANNTANGGDWPLTKSPGIISGSNLIVDDNVAAVSSVKINNNYFRYGKAQLLIKSGVTGIEVNNNKFSALNPPASNVFGTIYQGTALNFTYSAYWIRFDSIAASPNITGLTSGGAVANTTNVWLDGPNAGVALASPRASGIHSDV